MSAQKTNSSSKFLATLKGERTAETPLGHVVMALESHAKNGYGEGALLTPTLAEGFLSLESMGPSDISSVQGAASALESAMSNVERHVPGGFTAQGRDAAIIAGMMAGNIGTAMESFAKQPQVKPGQVLVEPQMAQGDFFGARSQEMKLALEAYDEKENRNATVYSVAYNLQAARQDDFGEAFFPTVVVTPDQVGYTVSIRVITVYNELRRQINGNLDKWNKRNIIHAVIDPTILKNDQTKIIPVHRVEAEKHFVPTADITPFSVMLDDESITTSALAFGKRFSLLAISQTEALLETGLLDSTDSIDPSIRLDKVYLKTAAGDVIEMSTAGLTHSNFTYSTQGNYRNSTLNFDTKMLGLKGVVNKLDGTPAASLAQIDTLNVSVRIGAMFTGTVNVETAETIVNASDVEVYAVTQADGTVLDMESGNGKVIADLFVGAKFIGYSLEAYRTNMNRRQRGQLLDTTFYSQIYTVPLRAPITVPRPLSTSDSTDAPDLAALITATHIRTSNAAVAELIRVNDLLAEHVHGNDLIENAPNIFGVASWLVTPFHSHEIIDLDQVIDSHKSHERAADIQAALVNILRDKAYRMYRDSGFKAAADAMAGGISAPPTVIIGTDPVIARYLMVTGDFRTLGPDFEVKVVSTLDNRMEGRIFMTFGEFGNGKEGQPNPLHFGNMAWKPELTLVLPLHRNGANSKELTVQPSFLHITNLPILASFIVKGIPDTVNKKVPVAVAVLP